MVILTSESRKINPILANNLTSLSENMVPEGSLDKYRQGSLFVPFSDSVKLHLAQSEDEGDAGLIKVIDRRGKTIYCRRSWSRTINIIQLEDKNMFGYQFCSIPCIKPDHKAAMMIWSLSSIMSSVKALWHEVDSMDAPYLHDGWEGHFLSFIQSKVFSFQTIRVDNKSPFKNQRSDSSLIDIINNFNPSTSNMNKNMTEPSTFYNFFMSLCVTYFYHLFILQ